MRLLAVLLLAGTLHGGSAVTSLDIVIWPRGEPGPHRAWTLRCAPAGGTLPHAATACRKLLALRDPFAPTPPDTACTQIYGGPQVARMTGTFRGRRVSTVFRRRDGCETARWNRVAFLFPVRV
jgi:hypothetical protein